MTEQLALLPDADTDGNYQPICHSLVHSRVTPQQALTYKGKGLENEDYLLFKGVVSGQIFEMTFRLRNETFLSLAKDKDDATLGCPFNSSNITFPYFNIYLPLMLLLCCRS
jgi:hypothetical protein